MGFDPVTMAATISKLKASGQIGSGTPEKVFATFDGDLVGKVVIDGADLAEMPGYQFVKVSDEVIPQNKLGDVEITAPATTVRVSKSDMTFEGNGEMYIALCQAIGHLPMLLICSTNAEAGFTGTLVGYAPDGKDDGSNGYLYVSTIYTAETIKPIDPKYLPYNYERKVIYDGKPTKLDLTAYGMGFSYQLSAEDMLPLSQGQDVHFAYEVDGVKTNGILGSYWFMNPLNAPGISDDENKTSLIYVAALGGTGFTVSSGQDASGLDLGEISNLKLWIELRENVPYYITSYNAPGGDAYVPFSNETAFSYSRKGLLLMRYFNGGGWGTTKHPLAVEPSYNDDRPNTMYVYDVIGTWLEFDVPNPYLTARKLEFVDGVYKPPEA